MVVSQNQHGGRPHLWSQASTRLQGKVLVLIIPPAESVCAEHGASALVGAHGREGVSAIDAHHSELLPELPLFGRGLPADRLNN